MKYFEKCNTIADLKKAYRKLASIYHPDNSTTGNVEIMQAINNEYEFMFEKLQKVDKDCNKQETGKDFINIVNELIKYNDLIIDIIGSWIWLDGNTYPIKDIIKSMGFLWSKSRKKWYYNGSTEKTRVSYRQKDFNSLKSAYGCSHIESKKAGNGIIVA